MYGLKRTHLLESLLIPTKVHKAWWYMLHYGGPTPKRHYAYSNSSHVGKLWMGRLRNWAATKDKLAKAGKAVELTEKYIDKQGKRRWKGSRSLRSSESDT